MMLVSRLNGLDVAIVTGLNLFKSQIIEKKFRFNTFQVEWTSNIEYSSTYN